MVSKKLIYLFIFLPVIFVSFLNNFVASIFGIGGFVPLSLINKFWWW